MYLSLRIEGEKKGKKKKEKKKDKGDALQKNGTQDLVFLLPDKNIVGSKWLTRSNLSKMGFYFIYKKLVGKGFYYY